jgi:hypothetical protein
VEVGQTVLALNLVHTELDLAEGVVLIVLQIGEGDLENAALQRVVGVLQTAGAVDQSLADTLGDPLVFHEHTHTHTQKQSKLGGRGDSYSRVWKVEGACTTVSELI